MAPMEEVIRTCPSSSQGGGVYVNGGTATFLDCEIHSNGANTGGGVRVNPQPADSTATFTDCHIYSNLANYGGGVNVNSGGVVNLDGCDIHDNEAYYVSPCPAPFHGPNGRRFEEVSLSPAGRWRVR